MKTKIGLFLIILGFISPIFGLIVPVFGFSSTTTTTLVAFFLVGGPEIFLVLGAALAGKEGIIIVKNRIKRLLGLPEGKYYATNSQYNFALILMVIWLISLTLPFYVPAIQHLLEEAKWEWYYFVIGDVVFVLAFIFIGGDQLITKFAKLFTWEPWKTEELSNE